MVGLRNCESFPTIQSSIYCHEEIGLFCLTLGMQMLIDDSYVLNRRHALIGTAIMTYNDGLGLNSFIMSL